MEEAMVLRKCSIAHEALMRLVKVKFRMLSIGVRPFEV